MGLLLIIMQVKCRGCACCLAGELCTPFGRVLPVWKYVDRGVIIKDVCFATVANGW